MQFQICENLYFAYLAASTRWLCGRFIVNQNCFANFMSRWRKEWWKERVLQKRDSRPSLHGRCKRGRLLSMVQAIGWRMQSARMGRRGPAAAGTSVLAVAGRRPGLSGDRQLSPPETLEVSL